MAGLEKLQNLDPNDMVRITKAIEGAVASSYLEDQKRERIGRQITHRTQWEDKRRVNLAIEIFRSAYCEKGWGLSRSLGELSTLLRKRLDGVDWTKEVDEERTVWLPGDGQ